MNQGFLSKWDHSGVVGRERVNAFPNEMRISYVAISLTLISIVAFSIEGGAGVIALCSKEEWAKVAELVIGRSLFGFFLFSGLVYQLTRLGYLKRFARHRATPISELERVYRGHAPSLAILVPSYMEEPHVVRQTLLAAALQQYPNRRVVLLIDDPPAPRDRKGAARLAAMRNLPVEINALFAAPSREFEQALADFRRRESTESFDPQQEVERLVTLLWDTADWLDRLADATAVADHTDVLFVERILRTPARSHRARALALRTGPDPTSMDLLSEYRRLAAQFKVEVTSFERKRYANLSHEPNKAMNLNSYIGLMGKSFREAGSPDGHVLKQTDDARATLRIPNADFIIVVDADSLILPEYSLRLMHFMTRPGNERVAVVQTPYASVPGAPSMIERIAGATTDVQLMSHQGATLFGAGSWVGASALVRRTALDDIVDTEEERGYPVLLYIRDRTLNEDTDTTVDLIRKGWTVYNYPDRLAYSATPPDFGSLLIQRRRSATGGLLILPNVFRYFLDSPSFRRLSEALIWTQYILSAPVGSSAILVLTLAPFAPGTAWSSWPLLAFLAYLLAFQRDLRHNGDRASNLVGAMALNAMLLPVNLSGAINSLQQLWTGRKIPFQRTPKVDSRTAARPAHIAAQFGFLLLAGIQVPLRLAAGRWMECLFFGFYAAAFGYALQVFIGWHAAMEDFFGGLKPQPRLLSKRSWNKSVLERK